MSQNGQAPAAQSAAWSIEYDDFSAFHLDGSYLAIQSSGHPSKQDSTSFFAHVLKRGSEGAEERVYQGYSPQAELSSTMLAEAGNEIEALDFSKLISPPARTLIPDEFVTRLNFRRQKDGKVESVSIRYVKGSAKDIIRAEVQKLLEIVGSLETKILKTKTIAHHTKIRGPEARNKTTKEQALKIALKAGFSATWTHVELCDSNWVISGRSKSATPPQRAVVSVFNGSLVKYSENSDTDPKLTEYSLGQASESYDVGNLETKPTWTKRNASSTP